ncbi:aminopeptidase [Burkholderia stabilis]|uniref:Aminopeptidase n=1 Tax=Burkholderia stabilis TaxID=95485 RepID=A0A4Q2A4L7_9BURK|nr:M55 family metallopeptidase [Burkholderia stabilis]RXV64212.1 aminopeptidase [Burkholderia stabilis]
MKILISTDIEGVAGVFATEQTRAGNPEYERARRWMTAEANAAIEGAFASGAQAVWINDSHGGFRNLLPDRLDARARVVLGKPRMLGMMAGLEQRPDLVFMIGYHAKSQTRGVLAHTISLAFSQVWLNGVELGEAGLYGALAHEYGAHVALATGDDVFAEETQPLFPDARFETVKTAGGATSGDTLTPAASSARIATAARDTVAKAVSAGVRAGSHRPAPAACTLRVQTAALADLFCVLPSLERIDAVTLRFDGPSVEHVVRTLHSLSAMSFMLR